MLAKTPFDQAARKSFESAPDGGLIAFHGTRSDIADGKFAALSHFGTLDAASDRLYGTSFGSSLRLIETQNIPPPPGGNIHRVILDIKKPFPIKDVTYQNFDDVLSDDVLRDAGVPDHEIKQMHALPKWRLRDLFHVTDEDPRTNSLVKLYDTEIDAVGIFSLKDHDLKTLKDHRIATIENGEKLLFEDRYLGALTKKMQEQRTIVALEKLGYDGLVYANTHEGAAHPSYMIFRSHQARPYHQAQVQSVARPAPASSDVSPSPA